MMRLTCLFAVLGLGSFVTTFAQDESPRVLMRAKLQHSKALLEGLATEDYEGLARHSDALRLLSLETDWNVIQTGQYGQLSEDFRRSAQLLNQSAKAKNLDGATLAYVSMTMKCIECHKYVRSVQGERVE
jgi:hypothetical protein